LIAAGPEGIAAGVIGQKLQVQPAILSFHLKELSHAGLVTSRQEGRFVYYAKGMMDDPRINFAVSKRGARPGVDHLGFQVDSDEELSGTASPGGSCGDFAFEQPNAECCYARSDKYRLAMDQRVKQIGKER
jgi:DNA-binding transcriptional ArsR family regulator